MPRPKLKPQSRWSKVERQCLERNRHLGDPARLVEVAAVSQMTVQSLWNSPDVLVEHVVAHAVGVGLEAIAAAARVERVEDHHEPIVRPQALAVPHVVRQDVLRLAVVHARADVEGVVVVQE